MYIIVEAVEKKAAIYFLFSACEIRYTDLTSARFSFIFSSPREACLRSRQISLMDFQRRPVMHVWQDPK